MTRPFDGNGYTTRLWEPVVTFIVPGQPKSKARPRFGRGRTYTEPATVAAETRVIDAFENACPLWEPSLTLMRIDVDIHYKGAAIGDFDNVLKLACDALQGHAYVNDRQLRKGDWEVFEHAGDRAGLVITLHTRKEP